MFVKIKIEKADGWKVFGGFKDVSYTVHHQRGKNVIVGGVVKEDFGEENIVLRADVEDYTQRPCTEDEARGGVVELWLFGKTPMETRQILSFTPVFIMNDDGKTIERV